jgi:hypothetical protein
MQTVKQNKRELVTEILRGMENYKSAHQGKPTITKWFVK